MTKLIVAAEDSAAGCLKQARMADQVVSMAQENLCVGPIPSLPDYWGDIDAMLRDHDRIEIWADPDPNAQLHMIGLLDWLGRDPALARKLSINAVDYRIGECRPEEVVDRERKIREADPDMIDLASISWNAFCQPTPTVWRDLLDRDLSALPHLRSTVLRLLAELPSAATGLTASEHMILELISGGASSIRTFFQAAASRYPDLLLDYWTLGQALDRLSEGDHPLILGLTEGPFTLALHDDETRHGRYLQSELSLSPLGEALLRGGDDLTHHARIERWPRDGSYSSTSP